MQMHRLIAVGRWVMVTVIVAACGCAEGEWDWFGLNKSSKDKPVTKARRPAPSEPEVAEAKQPPEPAADDGKSREVDEKVERYVRSMESEYDPSYPGNDFSSKIQRQSDPDRAARVRQTAIRSRTEPAGDETGTASAEGPAGEPASDEPHEAVQKENSDGNEEREEGPASDPNSPAPQEPIPEGTTDAETRTSPNPERPSAPEDAKSAESAMKPPVLSQVMIAPSPTPVQSESPDQKSASPVESDSGDEKRVEAAASNNGSAASTTAEKNSISADDESVTSPATESEPSKAPPVHSAIDDSPSPKPEAHRPPVVADHNATEATPNESTRVEAPVEKPRGEDPLPKPARSEPEVVKISGETPNNPARPAPSSASPPATGGDFKKKLQAQESVVAKNPDDVEEQFKLRMMYLVDGQDEKALASSPSMNAETQEIMLGQIRAVMAARSSISRDPAQWANQQLEALETLRGLLRAKADLQVPKVELCRAIEGFGRYEPFNPLEFKAGAKNRVLLYIEVDNFQSETTASGMFRTLLSVRESLMNKNGEELWSAKDDNIEDLARRKRRDFYLTIGPLAIPKSLGPGEYVFKVEVEDVLGGKINSNVVRFKMVP